MCKKTVDTIPILSKGIENILFSFSNSRSLPGSLIKRSNIILLASKGVTNQNISKQVGLHYNHVGIWHRRFLDALPALPKVETGNPDKLKDEIKLLLSDAKRSGAPAEFSAEQSAALVRYVAQTCCPPATLPQRQ